MSRLINQFLQNLSLGYSPEAAFNKTKSENFDASGIYEDELQWPSNLHISLEAGVVSNNAVERGDK